MVIKKDNKSGQAEIITTVLIILMVLVAIIIVWNVVKFTVVRSAENIGTSALTTQLDLENVELYITGGASIKIHRNAGEGNITKLKFIFYDYDGKSHTIEKDGSDENCKIPNELETKICVFDSSEVNFEVVKVSVVPMFGKNAGMEIKEENPKTDLPVSGLVSWWKFEGNTKDSVGGNDGNISGVGNDANTNENVLNLDGVDDYVDVGNNANLNIQNEITISAWVKPKSASTGAIVVKNGPYYFVFDSSQKTVGGIFNGSWTWLNGESIIPLNQWTHVVLTYNSPIIKNYFNGVEDSATSKTGLMDTSSQDSVKIGYGTSTFYFNGAIDDVMIFNKGLSSDEITAIYNNQKPGKI